MTSCLQHTIHYGGHSSRTHKVRLELNNLVCFNLVGAAAGWFLLHQDDLNCSKNAVNHRNIADIFVLFWEYYMQLVLHTNEKGTDYLDGPSEPASVQILFFFTDVA